MSGASGCAANPLLPQLCRVAEIRQESPDVITLRLQNEDGSRPFAALPGQTAMLSLLGVGEAMFSVSNAGEDWLEFTVKQRGTLTQALHELYGGETVGLRGPYGNHFPLAEAHGRDLLFIAGGSGLAPLRFCIDQALTQRADYGRIDILYGARDPEDLLFKQELFSIWPQRPHTALYLTVEQGSPGWQGRLGLVPAYLEQCAFSPHNRLALLCGPSAMLALCLKSLNQLGFAADQIVTTLERRMSCGVGLCGRCNIGGKYVCLEGPVFTQNQLQELPDEIF